MGDFCCEIVATPHCSGYSKTARLSISEQQALTLEAGIPGVDTPPSKLPSGPAVELAQNVEAAKLMVKSESSIVRYSWT